MTFGKREEQIFLGREISQHRDYSEETAQAIDHEVKRLVTEAHDEATGLLEGHLEVLHNLAGALLVEETLDAEAVLAILAGKPRGPGPPSPRTRRSPRPKNPSFPLSRRRRAMTRPVPKQARTITLPAGGLELGPRTLIMGVVNVTPDSFSDGGRFYQEAQAVEQGLALAEAGADILDVGGESTRPGCEATPASEEMDRVLPVIEALSRHCSAVISIDTYKAEVAQAAVEAGAGIINDITALSGDPDMADVAARDQGRAGAHAHAGRRPAPCRPTPPMRTWWPRCAIFWDSGPPRPWRPEWPRRPSSWIRASASARPWNTT